MHLNPLLNHCLFLLLPSYFFLVHHFPLSPLLRRQGACACYAWDAGFEAWAEVAQTQGVLMRLSRLSTASVRQTTDLKAHTARSDRAEGGRSTDSKAPTARSDRAALARAIQQTQKHILQDATAEREPTSQQTEKHILQDAAGPTKSPPSSISAFA